MNQKFIDAGGYITASLLFFCALITTPLGIGMALSYPDALWPLGLLLLACSFAFVMGGISNIRRAVRKEVHTDSEMQVVQSALRQHNKTSLSAGAAIANAGILAHWTYTA